MIDPADLAHIDRITGQRDAARAEADRLRDGIEALTEGLERFADDPDWPDSVSAHLIARQLWALLFRALVEDYRFIVATTGATRVQAAARLGVSFEALEKAIERHGRAVA